MGTWGQGKDRELFRPLWTQAQEGEDGDCPEGTGVLRGDGSQGLQVAGPVAREIPPESTGSRGVVGRAGHSLSS